MFRHSWIQEWYRPISKAKKSVLYQKWNDCIVTILFSNQTFSLFFYAQAFPYFVCNFTSELNRIVQNAELYLCLIISLLSKYKDVPSRWTTNIYVKRNFLHYYFLPLVPVKLEVLVSTVGERSWFHVPFRLGLAFPHFAPRITFRCPWNYSVVRYDGERVFPPRNPHVLVI